MLITDLPGMEYEKQTFFFLSIHEYSYTTTPAVYLVEESGYEPQNIDV